MQPTGLCPSAALVTRKSDYLLHPSLPLKWQGKKVESNNNFASFSLYKNNFLLGGKMDSFFSSLALWSITVIFLGGWRDVYLIYYYSDHFFFLWPEIRFCVHIPLCTLMFLLSAKQKKKMALWRKMESPPTNNKRRNWKTSDLFWMGLVLGHGDKLG